MYLRFERSGLPYSFCRNSICMFRTMSQDTSRNHAMSCIVAKRDKSITILAKAVVCLRLPFAKSTSSFFMQPQSEHLTRWIFISTKVFEQPIGTLTKRLAVKPLRTTLWLPHSGQQSLSDGVWIFKTILLLSQRISKHSCKDMPKALCIMLAFIYH